MATNIESTLCSGCKYREAFFFRPYSGERLCQKCFAQSIESKVRGTVVKYQMINFNDRIAVAISGGKDSTSLLHLLAKMMRFHPMSSLVGVTVDEGIEGYRDEALNIARTNCQKLGVGHYLTSFKKLYGLTMDDIVAKARLKGEKELTPCAFCGVLRRKALNLAAREVKATKIATAHTLDDEVQTVLMNIFRGDILRLAKEKPITDKVHPQFVQKIKPFCEVPEKESTLYAYTKGIRFQDAPCPYAAEALRNDARTMLNRIESKHAGTKFSIIKSIERIRPTLVEIIKKDDFRECIRCGEPSSSGLCRACELLSQID
jgi:uncharacterized protein (TIGR00269 family)